MSPPFSFHVVPRLPNPAKEVEDLPAHEVTFPPRPYWESTPILIDMNPESGSMTGGMKVWLKGFDFSPGFPVFAMFGDVAVLTVRVLLFHEALSEQISQTFTRTGLLACRAPPAAAIGVVDVTLSKYPHTKALEYGTSIVKYRYLDMCTNEL